MLDRLNVELLGRVVVLLDHIEVGAARLVCRRLDEAARAHHEAFHGLGLDAELIAAVAPPDFGRWPALEELWVPELHVGTAPLLRLWLHAAADASEGARAALARVRGLDIDVGDEEPGAERLGDADACAIVTRMLQRLPGLQRLEIPFNTLDGPLAAGVAACAPQLKKLSLMHLTAPGDLGALLARLPQLESLATANTGYSGWTFALNVVGSHLAELNLCCSHLALPPPATARGAGVPRAAA